MKNVTCYRFRNICSLVACLAFVSVAYPSLAQQKTASTPKPVSVPTTSAISTPTATSVSTEQKWEYIVVTWGKTEFSSPQKSLAYRPIGLQDGEEAKSLQDSLDILGRFGWEAVTIVGTIGGDQEIVLKRKYDKNRIVSEREAIARGTQLYIKDLADILEREESIREAERLAEEAEKNKPHLIDIDAEDAQAAKAARLAAFRDFYMNAFNNSELSKISTITIDYSSAWSDDIDVQIKADLTNRCLKNDGKSYRGNEAKAFLKGGIPRPQFDSNQIGQYASVKISATGFIQFQGSPVSVALFHDTFSGIMNRWQGF